MNCECNSKIVYPEGADGEKVCSNCGLVIDDTPNFKSFTEWTPEWYSNWDADDSETVKDWLTTLRSISCQLGIPNFPYREEAARTIRAQNRSLFRSQKLSKNKRATVAALMHLVLKEYNKTRSINEISKELSIDTKFVMKQTWILNKILNEREEVVKAPRKTAVDYLHQYSGKVTDNKEVIHVAEQTVLKLKKLGGNPIGLAAGALYNAAIQSKAKISKEAIGQAFHLSSRTVYANEARIRKLAASAIVSTAVLVSINLV